MTGAAKTKAMLIAELEQASSELAVARDLLAAIAAHVVAPRPTTDGSYGEYERARRKFDDVQRDRAIAAQCAAESFLEGVRGGGTTMRAVGTEDLGYVPCPNVNGFSL